MAYEKHARTTYHRTRIRRTRVAGLFVVIATIGTFGHQLLASSSSSATSPADAVRRAHRAGLGNVPETVWPAHGQAAFIQTGRSQVQSGPNQHPAAIASVAKVMTAYLVLHDHPLQLGEDGPTITLTDADVADTDRRRGHEESVVSIAAGTVHNTNTLLGYNGFVGVKTGSTAAAGGCFAFQVVRWIGGKRTTIAGVVLGQPGHDRIAAALESADAMVARITGQPVAPVPPQGTLPAPAAPPSIGLSTQIARRGRNL